MLLKEFITQVRGVCYKPNNVLDKGMGIPILRANNINDGKINLDDLIYIDKAVIKKEQILKSGDIVLCTSSGSKDLVGKAATFNGNKQDISFGAFCKVVRVIDCDKIKKDFIRLFFQSPTYKKQIADSSIGANINNIKTEHIDNLSIYIPSITVQNIAVKEINVLIESIDGLKKKLSYFDELIKSRFIEMFIDKGFNKKEIRAFVDIHKLSAKKKYSLDDQIEYIDISSISNESNTIIGSTSYLFKNAPSRAQQCLLRKDILVSTVRPNLKNIAIFDISNDGYVGSSGFCVLRSKHCNPFYLLHVVLMQEFTESMISLTTGASYPAIKDDDVLNYQMIDAPIELQNEFGEFVQLIDKSKFIVQKQIEDLKELLNKKMDEYFGNEEDI